MDKQLLEANELLLNMEDWNKRVRALQLVRKICGSLDDASEREIIRGICNMEKGLVAAIKDLRSQVCKEASVTICCLAEHFGGKLLKLFEVLLQCSIELCQTSAKVMACAGIEASNAIVKRIESPKLVQIILSNSTNKSKEIRRQVQSLVQLMLNEWSHAILESNVAGFVNCVKTGINDADKDSREFGRRNFIALEQHFPQEAHELLQMLDPNRKKGLLSMSAGSSTLSLANAKTPSLNKKLTAAPSARYTGFMSKRSISVTDMSTVPSRSTRPLAFRAPFQGAPVTPAILPKSSAPKEMRRDKDLFISESRRRLATIRSLGTPFKGATSTPSCPPRTSDSKDINFRPDVIVLNSESDDDLLEESSGIRNAVSQMSASSTSEKQKGLQYMLNVIKLYPTMMSGDESSKVYEQLNKMVEEGNHKVIGAVCETLAEFLLAFASSVEENMPSLLTTMLRKRSAELLPKSQESMDLVIGAIAKSFPADLIFYAICRFIGGAQFSRQSAKAKEVMIMYAADLLPLIPSGTKLDRADVKSALSTICQICDSGLRSLQSPSTMLLERLHDMHLEEYKLIEETLPLSCAEVVEDQQDQGSTLLPTSSVETRCSLPVTSTPLLLGDITVNEAPTSLNTTVSVQENSVVALHQPSDRKHCQPLYDIWARCGKEHSEQDLCNALRSLPEIIAEVDITTLDDLFPSLLSEVCVKLVDSRKSVRLQALKTLDKLSKILPERMKSRAEELMANVLKASQKFEGEYNIFTANAERECMTTLAISLPVGSMVAFIKDILTKENDGNKAVVLNVTAAWAKNSDSATIEECAPEIVPLVIKAYRNERSSVRKAVIFTLVEIVSSVGREKVDHYLGDLGKGIAILEKYLNDRDKPT